MAQAGSAASWTVHVSREGVEMTLSVATILNMAEAVGEMDPRGPSGVLDWYAGLASRLRQAEKEGAHSASDMGDLVAVTLGWDDFTALIGLAQQVVAAGGLPPRYVRTSARNVMAVAEKVLGASARAREAVAASDRRLSLLFADLLGRA